MKFCHIKRMTPRVWISDDSHEAWLKVFQVLRSDLPILQWLMRTITVRPASCLPCRQRSVLGKLQFLLWYLKPEPLVSVLLPTSALLLFYSLKTGGPQIHQMVCVRDYGPWQCISLCVQCVFHYLNYYLLPRFWFLCLSVVAPEHVLAHKRCCWHLGVMTENNLAKEWEALCSLNSGFNFLICSYDHATPLVAFVMRMKELITWFLS